MAEGGAVQIQAEEQVANVSPWDVAGGDGDASPWVHRHLEGRPASLEDRGRSQGPAAYPAAMRGARAIRDLGRGRFQGGHRVHAKNVFPPALTAPRRVMESGTIRKHLRHSTYNTMLLIVVVIAQHVNYLEEEYGICSTKTV